MGISLSSLYYQPRVPSKEDVVLMKLMDRQYVTTPFHGSRRMKLHQAGRKRYAVGKYL